MNDAIEENAASAEKNMNSAATAAEASPNQHNTSPAINDTALDEIQELKKKILELEARQSQAKTVDGPDPTPSETKAMAEIEQYKRMEACLYNHRKEWEASGGPGPWRGVWTHNRAMGSDGHSWIFFDPSIVGQRTYERPDIFDPSHDCGPSDKGPPEAGNVPKDEHDMLIDWGNRRDRVRKNFEWQMDRLFLDEELDNRKKAHVKSTEDKKRRERRMAKTDETELLLVPTSAQPKLNWLEWYHFKAQGPIAGKDASVVDILIGEPVIDEDAAANRSWFGYSGRRLNRDVGKSTGQTPFNGAEPDKLPLPERIRIHSDALLRILSLILGTEGRALAEVEEPTAVFIRPFKALMYREQALRDWCSALEKKFKRVLMSQNSSGSDEVKMSTILDNQNSVVVVDKAHTGQDTVTPSPSTNKAAGSTESSIEPPMSEVSQKDGVATYGSEDEDEEDGGKTNDLTKSQTALQHLQCLLRFIDSTTVAKNEYLNSPDCRKVYFSDLWHLFRPGMEVIGNDGKQAYKVLGVFSAKHRIVPMWERWYNNSSDSRRQDRKPLPFKVTCVYIDFDGTNIGPVARTFYFKRFDGEREVTSLEIYPLRFHTVKRSQFSDMEWQSLERYPVQERYRQKLIRRGTKFLEAAEVQHMYYAGPTIETKDEVESPVVIDFETAFTMQDDQAPPSGQPPPPDLDQLPESMQRPRPIPWRPHLLTIVGGLGPEEAALAENSCRGDCCRDEFVHDDQYVDQKQQEEYIASQLPKTGDMNVQPPITIMPRPLKELRSNAGSSAVCPEDELVIMSYRVFGFVLRNRKWAKLDLSYLSDIHPPEILIETTRSTAHEASEHKRKMADPSMAFNRLVLEEGHHSMIVSLIAQHFRDKKSTTDHREQFDLVKGKGKGLILLLHGAPGVGKTSTAEAVAELFKKPLFQITCGDLGTTASEVEKALEMNFSLANKWDCILLLDEADVFLAERTKEDFKRNGLVAVFLRLMEYYSGILFLTTNRVGDFDEAFTSRIHVSLYYPELNEEKTVKVFKINMDMIEDRFYTKGRKVNIERMEIGSFAAKYFAEHPNARWNGRQIRNACQTALALAEFEAQDNRLEDTENRDIVVNLTIRHFEVVRNAYLEFTKYMHDLYGSTAARRAKEARRRAFWQEENDRLGKSQYAGMDIKNAFLRASQAQPKRPPGHSPQQSFQQPTYAQHPGSYTQSAYEQPQPSQSQHYYQNSQYKNWSHQGSENPAMFSAQSQEDSQRPGSIMPSQQAIPSSHVQPQQQHHQAQSNSPWLNENIRNMYAASGQQGDGKPLSEMGGPSEPGWNCSTCGQFHMSVRSAFCPVCGGKA